MVASSPVRRSFRRGLVVVVLAIVGGVGWYCQQHLRLEWHKQTCKSHLKQLLTALHSYHEEHHCFPPAYTLGPDGERWHSWRVRILPQLGEQTLYGQYRFDEPWNSPHNAQLANRMPDVFGYPSEPHARFLAVVGRVTAWPEHFSTRIRDFTDGTSNTVLLVESADSTVNWLEPRDIAMQQVLERQLASSAPRFVGRDDKAFIGIGDGSVRAINSALGRDRLGTLLTPNSGGPTPEARSLPFDAKKEPPSPTFPPERPATDFPMTDVLPHATDPMGEGRNHLYCCTFRMAWDQLRPSPEEPVGATPRSQLVDTLNRLPFPAGQLDPAACLVMAVPPADVARITAAMTNKFPGAKGPSSVPTELPGVVIFAYLRKSLAFATEFDVLDEPLSFPNGDTSRNVRCFGRKPFSPGAEFIESQVRILDYRTDEDFVIELVTESKGDVLTLAKIPAEATLQQTIDVVKQRVEKPNPLHRRLDLEPPESLVIPRLSLNILKSYLELWGLLVGDNPIVKADQGIAFVLNERGAEVESFAEIGVVGEFGDDPAPAPPPPKIRRFIFDKPFLVMLRETQATEPYFALWVANAELMEPLDK